MYIGVLGTGLMKDDFGNLLDFLMQLQKLKVNLHWCIHMYMYIHALIYTVYIHVHVVHFTFTCIIMHSTCICMHV